MYLKLGRVLAARTMFDAMVCRNAMSFNILIGGLIHNGDINAARKLFNEMPKRNLAIWNAMIAGLAHFELDEEGLKCFLRSRREGLRPDEFGLGSTLRCCAGLKDTRRAQNGDPEGAFHHFILMKNAGLLPDHVTFVSIISACSDLATLAQGQQVHAQVIHVGVGSVTPVRSSLISMYSKCGCLEDSSTIFSEFDASDLVLWSSMIAAYGFHGRGEEAIKLFNEMIGEATIIML
ncbi:pentatricopeptide repeat-containing protein At2g41080-like [Zingiber officinale]|uniref:pentatricopeptide repeat-containing protein At2g41080-like n=1 Tax=Zingiber officinale TaxID=94328 RepID=UPI001C4CE5D9|nr:pentatricopeptide repeat-containing protein At2g41080-like [Zingiber officinale]